MGQAKHADAAHAEPEARLSQEILDACRALGFENAGIVAPAPSSHPDVLRQWLDTGQHGTMDWMSEHIETRLDAGRLIPGARSVLMVTDRYAAPVPKSPPAESARSTASTGRIAKYALGRDYHAVFRKRLGLLADRLRERFSTERFRLFVDTGPVLEREHAARAGLGFIGKNTLLIDPQAGSYILLGGIATTLALTPQAPPGRVVSTDPTSHCGECTRCIDACPTRAITPFSVDARCCISYLTIEHEGPINPSLQRSMGDWVFGCDICQDVCPFNSPDHTPSVAINPAYRPRPGLMNGRIELREILGWTPESRQAVLTVSAGKRASLPMMRRNAIIAAGNVLEQSSDPVLREDIRRIAVDPTQDLAAREAAKVVLDRSRGDPDPSSVGPDKM